MELKKPQQSEREILVIMSDVFVIKKFSLNDDSYCKYICIDTIIMTPYYVFLYYYICIFIFLHITEYIYIYMTENY